MTESGDHGKFLPETKMSQQRVLQVMRAVQAASSQCPCHGSGLHRHSSNPASQTKDVDYAFEVTLFESQCQMAASNVRYGPGVTAEIGMDMANMKSKKGKLLPLIH
jgi:hydroxyacid-oxoacid transhydrogenase